MKGPLEGIELTAAVQGLRDQLIAAAASSDQRIKFEVDEIDLDFAVELRRDATAKAGFKAWVTSGELQTGVHKGVTHRVTIKLRPRSGIDGGTIEIGNAGAVDLSDFYTSPEG